MRVIRHLARVPRPLDRAVLTLGNFDGVHLGHQAILRSAVERARAGGGQAIVLTFEPHPLTVVAPERAPAVIQPLHDRLATLRELGIDVTVLQRFTRQFAALDPEAFVREFLLRHLALRHLVVGYNVNFGRDRAGSAHTLRELGARLGFGVEVVGPVTVGAEQVSSTALREVLAGATSAKPAGCSAAPTRSAGGWSRATGGVERSVSPPRTSTRAGASSCPPTGCTPSRWRARDDATPA